MVRYMNKSMNRQNGAVLIIALVILIVLTILGVSSMQVATMEEIMAGNMKDCNQGFQAAEASIRDATEWISTRTTRPVADLTASSNIYSKDAYTLGDAVTPATNLFDWDRNAIRYGALDSTAVAITPVVGTCAPGTKPPSTSPLADLYSLPCSVIEEHSFIPDDLDPDTAAKGVGRYYYRITTQGFGGTDKSHPVLEAILFQRFN